jgi:hypothetical protein
MIDRFKMKIERRSARVYLSSIHIPTLWNAPRMKVASVAPIAHSLTIAVNRMIQRRRAGWPTPGWLCLRRNLETGTSEFQDR